jgi:uncharacterized protein YhbP (UPF0306 family)
MTEQAALEVPDYVLDYLREQRTFTLATASPSGIPHAGTFLYVNEGPALYFWTRPQTTTARHIERNPVVSFTIDDYAEDLRQTKGVQGRGEARVILSGEEVARVAAMFGDKFPDLSPGTTMSISFFRVIPTDLEFIDNTGSGGRTEGTFGAEFHRERAYSVFTDLPVEQIDTIGALLPTVEAEAGEVIVRQGGPADKFFIVVDGEVEVSSEHEGQPRTVASLGPGHFFGEVSIIRDTPRAATVTAKSSAKLLVVERDTFRDLVAQSLGTTEEFDSVIQERLEALGH